MSRLIDQVIAVHDLKDDLAAGNITQEEYNLRREKLRENFRKESERIEAEDTYLRDFLDNCQATIDRAGELIDCK